MPFAPIVVDVSPAESPPALRRSLLEACGQAMKTAPCVEAGASGAGESSIVATVRWTGSEHVRLEITLRGANQTVERDIDFGQHDALDERWRTAGLVVGTLASVLSRNELPSVGELPAPPEEKPLPKSEPEPPVEAAVAPSEADPRNVLLRTPHRTRERPEKTDVMIDLSALLGPGISGGPMRAGGEIGVRIKPPGAPVEPGVAVSYAESVSDVNGVGLRTFDAFIGFAPAGSLGGPFFAVVRGEGFVRWLEASASSNGSLGPTSQSRVLGGARIGIDGLVRVANPLSLFVGAAGIFAAGSTDVTVRGRTVGTIPALSYVLRAGLSFDF